MLGAISIYVHCTKPLALNFPLFFKSLMLYIFEIGIYIVINLCHSIFFLFFKTTEATLSLILFCVTASVIPCQWLDREARAIHTCTCISSSIHIVWSPRVHT